MIKEITMFTVVCDICTQDDGEGSEFRAWTTPETAREVAVSSGWASNSSTNKDLCFDCRLVNEDEEIGRILEVL